MALIFALSAQPKHGIIPSFGAWDLLVKKGAHLMGYAILAWLWHRALNGRKPWTAWCIAVLYAASDELHQSFVLGRNAQLVDVGIDALGATLGLLVALYFQKPIRAVCKLVARPIAALFDL